MTEKKAQQRARAHQGRPIALGVLIALSLATMALGAWLAWRQGRQVAAQPQPAAADPAFTAAPDFTLHTVDGTPVRLSDLRGKVVLLNFWATWCPPCKAEMPDLNALHEKYGAEHDFTVVGINMEERAADVAAFARARQITFPLLLDPEGAVSAGRYAIRSLPTSLIIDREGRIRDTWMGQISLEAMVARLQRVW